MSTEVVYDFRDKRNKSASTSVRVGSDARGNVEAFASAWAQAIDGITNGVIRSALALMRVDISTLTGNVAADTSDVEEIAAFEFKTTGIPKVDVNVPAILETLVDNDTGEMILTASAVAAFITMMEDGLTVGGTLISPCDVGGLAITTLNLARERSRASGTNKGR